MCCSLCYCEDWTPPSPVYSMVISTSADGTGGFDTYDSATVTIQSSIGNQVIDISAEITGFEMNSYLPLGEVVTIEIELEVETNTEDPVLYLVTDAPTRIL